MKTILVVDDDAAILDGVADLLSDRYRVMTARDGEEALAVVAASGPDIMVLDMLMPLLDGEGVIEQLKRRNIGLPVILASACVGLPEKARAIGVADWIEKPFDVEDLEVMIARLLDEPSGHDRLLRPPALPPADQHG